MDHISFDYDYRKIGDAEYRFCLGEPARDEGKRNLLVIGINPSNALPAKNLLDPTMTRIRNFVFKHEGDRNYDGYMVVNLYPLREPDPAQLPKEFDDDIIEENAHVIASIVQQDKYDVWAAWGGNLTLLRKLKKSLCLIIATINAVDDPERTWFTVGKRVGGGEHPRHPLYTDTSITEELAIATYPDLLD